MRYGNETVVHISSVRYGTETVVHISCVRYGNETVVHISCVRYETTTVGYDCTPFLRKRMDFLSPSVHSFTR